MVAAQPRKRKDEASLTPKHTQRQSSTRSRSRSPRTENAGVGKVDRTEPSTSPQDPGTVDESAARQAHAGEAVAVVSGGEGLKVGDRVTIVADDDLKNCPAIVERNFEADGQSWTAVYCPDLPGTRLEYPPSSLSFAANSTHDSLFELGQLMERSLTPALELKSEAENFNSESWLPTDEELIAWSVPNDTAATIAAILESCAFIRMGTDAEIYPDDEPELYRGWKLCTESPNGGMLAVDVLPPDRHWWSRATTEEFGYYDHEQAVEWLKRLIDRVIEAADRVSGQLSLLEENAVVEDNQWLFQEGDRIREKSSGKTGTITGQASPGANYVQWDDGIGGTTSKGIAELVQGTCQQIIVTQSQLDEFAELISCDLLLKDKIRGTFLWNSREWVATGGSSNSAWNTVWATPVVSTEQWSEPTYNYSNLLRNKDGTITRKGQLIKHNQRSLVLTGEKVEFVVDSAAIVPTEPQPSALDQLAADINQLHSDCEQALEIAQSAQASALEHAKEAGLLLLQAKRVCGHGGWEKWREANLQLPSSTATLYQRIADRFSELQEAGINSVKAAMDYLKKARIKSATDSQPVAEMQQPVVHEKDLTATLQAAQADFHQRKAAAESRAADNGSSIPKPLQQGDTLTTAEDEQKGKVLAIANDGKVTIEWGNGHTGLYTPKEIEEYGYRKAESPVDTPVEPDRERLGRIVRSAWVKWAEQQENPKPNWLTPWEELDEPMKEVDRQIGEQVAEFVMRTN